MFSMSTSYECFSGNIVSSIDATFSESLLIDSDGGITTSNALELVASMETLGFAALASLLNT